MELVSAIEQRRSVRGFLKKDVDIELVKEIIKLGTKAPTACNRQAWRFIIISDEYLKKELSNKNGSSEAVYS